jgi:hypothetical protein
MKRRVLLITGNSVPLPNAAQLAGEGDEIVRTRLKNRDNVYLADLCDDRTRFEHGGIPLDGICEVLPPQAVSGE